MDKLICQYNSGTWFWYKLSNTVYHHIVGGPTKEKVKFRLVADNATVTKVDIGNPVGSRNATSEINDDKLIVYLVNQETGVLDLIVMRGHPKNGKHWVTLSLNYCEKKQNLCLFQKIMNQFLM